LRRLRAILARHRNSDLHDGLAHADPA